MADESAVQRGEGTLIAFGGRGTNPLRHNIPRPPRPPVLEEPEDHADEEIAADRKSPPRQCMWDP